MTEDKEEQANKEEQSSQSEHEQDFDDYENNPDNDGGTISRMEITTDNIEERKQQSSSSGS
ncbi:MAG: hypothetical protein R8N23_09925 [Reichenbachiella sp.]|uniref:hypothetical protein n=1 Tax=Reichenbachiella sp. TaxID=2184521 RepID=UPI0029676AD7|nr:hypothetical protein [Reichenbachiella sp.]MDW3210177.1 hypothetical protein [Reichenbachiella sp.]